MPSETLSAVTSGTTLCRPEHILCCALDVLHHNCRALERFSIPQRVHRDGQERPLRDSAEDKPCKFVASVGEMPQEADVTFVRPITFRHSDAPVEAQWPKLP